jgi:hypothetical protein
VFTLETILGWLTRNETLSHRCTLRQPGQHRLMTFDKPLSKVASVGSPTFELIGSVCEDVVDRGGIRFARFGAGRMDEVEAARSIRQLAD